ncbi:hypothetical protein [Croceicoccus gelatinilyticus]|uniref:hypothetical protein n=1 Tax=Croceicoccus gelatinilyticus TaxID=2835536 RepID=UPI001BCEA4A3|nr:hypothetical protein [Croceicoccus gelatinilyticus]MBS7668159.1 hypothetical protein [Croceicoccus gelatinilyticus]
MRDELPLHDATFDGLVTQGNACTLYFSKTDGQGCEVELSGVDALQMDDFREGNIVVVFATTTGELIGGTVDLERLYPSPHPSAANDYHEKYEAHRSGKVQAIASGDLTFVELVPAIGADLLATCERVEIRLHRNVR